MKTFVVQPYNSFSVRFVAGSRARCRVPSHFRPWIAFLFRGATPHPHPSDDTDLKIGKFYAVDLWLLRLRMYVWENSEIMTLNTAACVCLELLLWRLGAIETTGQPSDTLLSCLMVMYWNTFTLTCHENLRNIFSYTVNPKVVSDCTEILLLFLLWAFN